MQGGAGARTSVSERAWRLLPACPPWLVMVMRTLCGAWHAFHNPFSNKKQSLQKNCCHLCRSCKSCVDLARACNLHICLHLQAGAMLCNQCQVPAQCAGHYTSNTHFKKVNSTAVLGTCRLKLLQFHMLRGLYIQVPMHAAQNITGSKVLQQRSCGTQQLHQDCPAALVENLLGYAAAGTYGCTACESGHS